MTFLLTGANLLNYLDRYILVALLPLIMAERALSHSQAGQLAAAFAVGYTICAPLFGVLGDRFKRPLLMVIGIAVWSLATSVSGLVSSFLLLLAVRAFVGVGEASFATISPGYFRDRLSDPHKLDRALSIFFTAIPVGSALGYVLGGLLAQHLSWQSAFFICGIPGLLLAFFIARLPETRTSAPVKIPVLNGLARIARQPIIVVAICGYVLNAFALNGIATFVSSYGQEIGFSNQQITTAFGGILVFTGIVGTLAGGKIASVLAARSNVPLYAMLRCIGIASLLAVPFVFFAFHAQHKVVFLVLCFIAELLIFATTAPVNSVIVQAAPHEVLSLTQGTTIFALNLLGSFPAPLLIGLLADYHGLGFSMQLSTLALLLSGLAWWWGGRWAATKTQR